MPKESITIDIDGHPNLFFAERFNALSNIHDFGNIT